MNGPTEHRTADTAKPTSRVWLFVSPDQCRNVGRVASAFHARDSNPAEPTNTRTTEASARRESARVEDPDGNCCNRKSGNPNGIRTRRGALHQPPRGPATSARLISMAAPNVKDLLALDVRTRLTLVQELWDSIVRDAQTSDALPVSDSERRELDDRLREDDEQPEAAISWPEARARLRNRS